MPTRRNFIRNSTLAGLGISISAPLLAKNTGSVVAQGLRVGVIGLDTSHSIAFTKSLNGDNAGDDYLGYKVVAAYPKGSLDIPSSVERIEGYTQQMKDMGVEIVGSIDELLPKVDVVLLETNDGRRHLEQALPVLKAGKRMFIDKPIAASLTDAMVIFNAAKHYGVPVFSSSSLRYIGGMEEIKGGSVGKIMGADVYSPATIEETHPDLFWYGIHGVEILFTAMETGCKTVSRAYTSGADVVTGVWDDGRIGTFRGIREGKRGYGGTIFGKKNNVNLGGYAGYDPLLKEVVKYFKSGVIPIQPEVTLEILAFMEAADISRKKGGNPVSMEQVMKKSMKESSKYKF